MRVGKKNRVIAWSRRGRPVPARQARASSRRRAGSMPLFERGDRLAVAPEGRIHAGERALLPLDDGVGVLRAPRRRPGGPDRDPRRELAPLRFGKPCASGSASPIAVPPGRADPRLGHSADGRDPAGPAGPRRRRPRPTSRRARSAAGQRRSSTTGRRDRGRRSRATNSNARSTPARADGRAPAHLRYSRRQHAQRAGPGRHATLGATGLAADPAEYRARLREQPDEQIDAWAARRCATSPSGAGFAASSTTYQAATGLDERSLEQRLRRGRRAAAPSIGPRRGGTAPLPAVTLHCLVPGTGRSSPTRARS